jgi:hypothetical protein
MKSMLKTLVPLVVLVGVVFGITLLFLYRPPEDPGPNPVDPVSKGGSAPLRFFTSTRHFDPKSDNLQDRFFTGYFEKNAKENKEKTSFWFENRNDKPVAMQLRGVSCSACSSGSLAPIPPEAVRNLLQTLAVTSLPQGLATPLPIGMAGPWADIVPKLQWQSHKFETTDWTFTVPAAVPDDRWSPSQWGILELNFGTGGKTQLEALFASQVQGTNQYSEDKFLIAFQVVNPFDVAPTVLDVGEMKADDKPQSREFLVYSATRGPGTVVGELPVPAFRILMPGGAGEPGKLITIETPVPLSPAECERLADRVSGSESSVKARVTGAFRVPVRITPEAGGDRLDIGLLEREIWVTVPGTGAAERQVRVNGKVRGSVSLSDAKEVALGTFKGEEGRTRSDRITTDRPGMDLAVVPGECRPDFLEVSLKKLPDDPDRGYYQLTVKVPPKRQFGSILNGLVVLEIKGPKPQRIRIPVTGKGEF